MSGLRGKLELIHDINNMRNIWLSDGEIRCFTN